jgi:hypothetical protein
VAREGDIVNRKSIFCLAHWQCCGFLIGCGAQRRLPGSGSEIMVTTAGR